MPHVVACTPMSHEMVLSVATSVWLHNFPELSLLPLVSFHCLLRAAEARHLRWCDVQTLDGSLSTRYEQVCKHRSTQRVQNGRSCSPGTCLWNVLELVR